MPRYVDANSLKDVQDYLDGVFDTQLFRSLCVDIAVRKTKGQIRIHSENLDKTSVSKPKKIFYSTDPDLKDLKGVLKELR
jgi:hypothetical protein